LRFSAKLGSATRRLHLAQDSPEMDAQNAGGDFPGSHFWRMAYGWGSKEGGAFNFWAYF